MREQIQRFMKECPEAKKQAFTNNSFANFVRADIPAHIYETGLVDREKYLVSASVGAGTWAKIPWICITDPLITKSPTEGVYIIYLLSADSKRLYLTFNQGCTKLQEQHNKQEIFEIMHLTAEKIRSSVSGRGFTAGNDIDLGDKLTSLGVYYREGTIFYRQYDVDSIPGESVLRDDLSRMLDIYADYVMSQKKNDRLGTFDSWTIIDEITAVKKCDKSFYDHNGSAVPKGIYWFFGFDELEAGKVIPITLIYKGKEYSGLLRNDSTGPGRVRIFWDSNLKKQLASFRDSAVSSATFIRIDALTYQIAMEGDEAKVSMKTQIEQIKAYIAAKGFSYCNGLIENFYLSMKSKPFLILAGTSGTGKTRLVRLFAEAIGAAFEQVAVRPDWSDSTDLFGHVDLKGKFIPGSIIDFLRDARNDPKTPYILCLDEMNLARVEYYMSDFLSVIETRELKNGTIVTDPLVSDKNYGPDEDARKKYGVIRFPENLFIVGTVNMDETTFPFSRKVLDRANTIEFNYVNLEPSWPDSPVEVPTLKPGYEFLACRYLQLRDCPDPERDYVSGVCAALEKINTVLQKANAHVGYRVRDEIVFYLLNNKEAGLLDENAALDNEIMQKILPRIQGSSASLKDMLCDLFKEIAGDFEGYQTESNNTADRMLEMLRKNSHVRYPKSAEKIAFMVRRFEEDGFTSYWL